MIDLKNHFVAATATVLATIATVGAVTPLRAETPSDMISKRVVVAYDDLDLATASGRATMDRRLRHAAESVCGPLDLAIRDVVQTCRRQAISDAGVRLAAVQAGNGAVRLAAAR